MSNWRDILHNVPKWRLPVPEGEADKPVPHYSWHTDGAQMEGSRVDSIQMYGGPVSGILVNGNRLNTGHQFSTDYQGVIMSPGAADTLRAENNRLLEAVGKAEVERDEQRILIAYLLKQLGGVQVISPYDLEGLREAHIATWRDESTRNITVEVIVPEAVPPRGVDPSPTTDRRGFVNVAAPTDEDEDDLF